LRWSDLVPWVPLVLLLASLLPATAEAQGVYKLAVGVGYTATYTVAPGGRTDPFLSYTESYTIKEIKTATEDYNGVVISYEYAVCEMVAKKGLGEHRETVDLKERERGILFFRIFYPTADEYWDAVRQVLENQAGEAGGEYVFERREDVIHYELRFKNPATGRENAWIQEVRRSDGVMTYMKIVVEGVTSVVYTLKGQAAAPWYIRYWYIWPAVGVGVAAAVIAVLWKVGVFKP